MNLIQRMTELHNLFKELSLTSSRNEKEWLVSMCRAKDEQLSKDLDWCFEYMSGQHKLGYKVHVVDKEPVEDFNGQESLEDFLHAFYSIKDLSELSISRVCAMYHGFGWFLNPLLNRGWRLGIGRSQLVKTDMTPMLAKKFEPDMKFIYSKNGYFITQKLDGNRCIAVYDYSTEKWEFYSRSGNRLRVEFNCEYLNKDFIYDGEVLSEDQLLKPSQQNFNSLSGKLNNKEVSRDLIYYIFDITNVSDPYYIRRQVLDKHFNSNNVKILPVMATFSNWHEMCDNIFNWLDAITSAGGEGVMINIGDATYQHKRTDKLLKLKKVQSMDMEVIELIPGTGKNEGLVGSLLCMARDGKNSYHCLVGSGLLDSQRVFWTNNPDQILHRVVEVQYFSLSQDKNTVGTNNYCLRFPRLKRVRYDKDETSIY